MWKKIVSIIRPKKNKKRNICERLHGGQGKFVPFPKDTRELDERYGPVMRELARH